MTPLRPWLPVEAVFCGAGGSYCKGFDIMGVMDAGRFGGVGCRSTGLKSGIAGVGRPNEEAT